MDEFVAQVHVGLLQGVGVDGSQAIGARTAGKGYAGILGFSVKVAAFPVEFAGGVEPGQGELVLGNDLVVAVVPGDDTFTIDGDAMEKPEGFQPIDKFLRRADSFDR